MTRVMHGMAALLATALIATFLGSSVTVELVGRHGAIATVKQWIVFPGLAMLVPALALTGLSGLRLARHRRDALLARKLQRMRLVAANGLLILTPCALYLDDLASAGRFDARFAVFQGLELCAGCANIALMALNMRDGWRMSRGHAVPPGRLERTETGRHP